MTILSSQRFSPTIFLGLGGSGGKVVDALAAKLLRHPHFHRFQDLIHFVALDTNKADLGLMKHVPNANRFLLSAFDRRAYVERKRGVRELGEDTFATAWIHENYQFRDTQGAGAGQIRVESRLGLHYNLEDDRAKIRASIARMLDAATRPSNAFRDSEDRVVNVMMYGSLAGGTGSGAALPMAYLLQDIVRDHGWGRPNVVGTLMLPSLFKQHVEQPLHSDIDANAYAALKEIEHAMRLGYEGCEETLALHHDPVNPHRTDVRGRPFSVCYLIDRPGELAVERYVQAVADASFLQVFSPILGTQAGEYDNYEKHQKSLALGHFTVHFATLGAALLVLPRKDIVHYAALRFTARALEQAVLCATEAEFRVDVMDPRFQKLTRDEQELRIDRAFRAGVDYGANEEEKRQEPSVYTGVAHHKMPDGKSLREGFQARLAKLWEDLDSAIAIEAVDPVNITEESPSLTAATEKLRREVTQSRERIDSQVLLPLQAELRSSRFWDRFFGEANGPSPLAQRYALIALRSEEFLGPYEQPEQNEGIRTSRENPGDLSNPQIKELLESLGRELSRTASRGLFGRMARENRAFEDAKSKAVEELNRLGDVNRDALKVSFWSRFHEELQKSIQIRLATFRAVAQIADEAVLGIQKEAERFMADPASEPTFQGDATAYYLDAEALRDDREGKRLWNLLFDDQLNSPAYFDPARLAAEVTEAFKPDVLPGGEIRPRDATRVVRHARERIYALGVQTFGDALERDLKLDMTSALRLEAGYLELGLARERLNPQQRRDALQKIPEQAIARHVRDKIARSLESCVLLAHIDQTRRDDPTVTPNSIFYVGLAQKYASDEPGSLREHLMSVAPAMQLVPSWDEPDLVVFYRALLGIPVYFFKRVNDELNKAYGSVRDRKNRSYPLHIDRRWETSLPDLDPVEIRKAEERRRHEETQARANAERADRLKTFSLCQHLGHVVRNEDGTYDWSIGPVRKRLAPSRAAAFDAFWALDPGLRRDLEKAAGGLELAATSANERRRLAERLRTHLEAISQLYYQAIADEQDRDKHLLDEEKALFEQLMATHGG
jgi:Tubulin like